MLQSNFLCLFLPWQLFNTVFILWVCWRGLDQTTQDVLGPNDHDTVCSGALSDTCRIPCFLDQEYWAGILLPLLTPGCADTKLCLLFPFVEMAWMETFKQYPFLLKRYFHSWNLCHFSSWQVHGRNAHFCSLRLGITPECTFLGTNSCSGEGKCPALKWAKFLRSFAFKMVNASAIV